MRPHMCRDFAGFRGLLVDDSAPFVTKTPVQPRCPEFHLFFWEKPSGATATMPIAAQERKNGWLSGEEKRPAGAQTVIDSIRASRKVLQRHTILIYGSI